MIPNRIWIKVVCSFQHTHRGKKTIYALALLRDMPRHIPHNPNPRGATKRGKIVDAIKETVRSNSEQRAFLLLHGGFEMTAAEAKEVVRDDEKYLSIDFGTAGGIVNGNTGYETVMGIPKNERGADQEVLLKVTFPMDDRESRDVAEARNRGKALPKNAMAHIDGAYEPIVAALTEARILNRVSTKPNDPAIGNDNSTGLSTRTDWARLLAMLAKAAVSFQGSMKNPQELDNWMRDNQLTARGVVSYLVPFARLYETIRERIASLLPENHFNITMVHWHPASDDPIAGEEDLPPKGRNPALRIPLSVPIVHMLVDSFLVGGENAALDLLRSKEERLVEYIVNNPVGKGQDVNVHRYKEIWSAVSRIFQTADSADRNLGAHSEANA